MAKWFYGMGTCQAKVTVDLRPGGNFEIGMLNEKGEEEYKPHGAYLEIAPPERLVFTWTAEYRETRHAELAIQSGAAQTI